MDPVIVIGAGISGVAAARTLRSGGLEVVVLDRGRRMGGRMAVRTTNDRAVDIGASYFTVSDPAFESVVQDWRRRGLARAWTNTFHVHDHSGWSTKTGPMRWAAPAGLRSLVEDLATDLEVRQRQVMAVAAGPTVDDLAASAVVLAMPDPQARRLLHPALATEISALDAEFEPVLVLTAAWPQRCWEDQLDGAFVSDRPTLSWVADDGRRRGDQAPVLVAHSTPSFAADHLDAPQDAVPAMVEQLQRLLDIDQPPATATVHRWSFAKPASTRTAPFLLADSSIGVCGDAWSERPRVESAYLSGVALGDALVDRLA